MQLYTVPNHLAHATSPYLRQHADNPVDWYVWGPEALARARDEDKPILLSVGYSACHWCHVMAHESFEDPETAALMNEHFVNIKVDREERPDIDDIYQKVVMLMGQGGGWPLTVFLLPDQRPFYAGTYFPPDDRYGRPGFPRLLQTLAQLWTQQRDDVLAQAERFMQGFADLAKRIDEDGRADLTLSEPAAMHEAVRRLVAAVDPEWGGIGRAPKFPNVPSLRLLLHASKAADASARQALGLTLEKMSRGGIYDHLRGGFARYSTDREWLIPHFEKMLYDNALLLELYAEASLVFDKAPHLRRVVEQTAEYLLADMCSDRGSFYSATDADSEGVEGKYFGWTPAQLIDALGEPLARTFARAYGVSESGNFEHGLSVLHLPQVLPPALERELEAARMKLLELRYARVPPLRDDKILTAWNALVISGLCKAAHAAASWGEAQRVARWTAAAEACGVELLGTHVSAGRTLRASWAGQGHTRAYLEDVALLARACLDLHELTLAPRWHEHAERRASEIMQHYLREGGGLFNTAADAETLIERTESQHDSPLPSGVAVAIEVLARLELGGAAGHAAAPAGARELIERTLARFAGVSARPFAYAGLIDAARWAGDRAVHVTIRAATPADGQSLAQVVRSTRARLDRPIAISFVELAGKSEADALVCRAQTCSMPIADADALREALRA